MEPFLAGLGLFSFNFAPKGWAQCNGQLLPINQNQALFSLLGTTYGGDGRVTFALPNLQGRAAMHMGSGHTLGERAGSVTVALNSSQMPAHTHTLAFAPPCNTNPGTIGLPTGAYPAASPGNTYATVTNVNMGLQSTQTTTGNTGASQPIGIEQPYLVLNYCIALVGIFPSQN